MRKEDVLANEDGVFPIPLQTEKIYNGDRKSWDDGWKNIIAYGDNLQFLKTIYENKDPLIKNKVKGKVKLIYIDPPFDSKADYRTRISLPSVNIEQQPRVIEQFAYSDTWKNGTISYLEMLIPLQ